MAFLCVCVFVIVNKVTTRQMLLTWYLFADTLLFIFSSVLYFELNETRNEEKVESIDCRIHCCFCFLSFHCLCYFSNCSSPIAMTHFKLKWRNVDNNTSLLFQIEKKGSFLISRNLFFFFWWCKCCCKCSVDRYILMFGWYHSKSIRN